MKSDLPLLRLLSLLAVLPAPILTATTASDAALLRNGTMEGGSAQPASWRIWHKKEGALTPLLTRDTVQRFGGEASLRVEHPTLGYSSTQSDLARTAPRVRVRAAARIKAEEIEALDLGIQCFDENRKQIRWLSLVGLSDLESQWRTYEGDFELPAGTVTWQFVMGFRGRGVVWLDEVSVTPLE